MVGVARRLTFLLLVFLAIFAFVFYSSAPAQPSAVISRSSSPKYSKITTTVSEDAAPAVAAGAAAHAKDLGSSSSLRGSVIAPKLGNETVKAELGRSAWRLLHTMMARFPDEPTRDESDALRDYIYLFQRLYPCGECAQHFGLILDQFPPQVSSRSAAAVWACHVHNEVNRSLNKDIFDCANIGDFYDCGCAEDEESAGQLQEKEKRSANVAAKKRQPRPKPEMSDATKDKVKTHGREVNEALLAKHEAAMAAKGEAAGTKGL